MPPANASAISSVLTDIANITPPLLTRPEQQTYLEKLTSTHKFTYYSSTYGHTIHDAASLRKVLANAMRHHPNPEFGVAGGNAAVDTLFQFGCEMLEPGYVDAVRRAAGNEVVERREVEEEDDEESEDEEGEEMLGEILLGAGGDSERDEDFVPPGGRRLRKRMPVRPLKRKISSQSTSERDSLSSEEGWKSSERKKILKRKHAIHSATSTPSSSHLRQETKEKQETGPPQRSHVGERHGSSTPQQDQDSGREDGREDYNGGPSRKPARLRPAHMRRRRTWGSRRT